MKGTFYKHHYVSAITILIISIPQNILYFMSFIIIPPILYIFCLLLISFLSSINYGLFKILMNKYYFSPYKLSYVIGLINMIILIIICIILTFIPCSEKTKFFCKIGDEEKNYFISFKSYFSSENLKLIIISFIMNIFESFQKLLIIFLLFFFK